MSQYVMVASRDPFETADVAYYYDLAASLARSGCTVTLFLVQNGVLPARRSARSGALTALSREGVEVLADDFSLRERGIAPGDLAQGVRSAALDVVVDLLAEGRKALWH